MPTSRSRVADCDPDYDRFSGIGSPSRVGSPLYRPLYDVCSPTHKGHEDLTSSPPSSGLAPAVSLECSCVATNDKGCARCGTYPNISRHELTTAMQHLCAGSLSSTPKSLQDSCHVKGRSGFSRCIVLNHISHRLCGSPSIPWSFNLAAVLPRRSTSRVSFVTESVKTQQPVDIV